jgi:arabinose-5-phosphate isomerase
MHTDVPLVTETTPMSEALLQISQKGFGVVGVTDSQGQLLGIITDGDLRRHMAGLLAMLAGDVMTRAPRTVAPAALAEQALAIMNDRKITCLFVVEPGTQMAIGIVHIHDCLRAGVI